MAQPTRRRFREGLLAWADENLREFAWREPDRSFYEVFVAEFFLTQTPATNVAETYPRFLRRFPELQTVRNATRAEVADAIEPLGFQNMRARALRDVAADYDELPREREALEQLPRVGPYVANATVCFAEAEPVPILDRNVRRVYQRVFGDSFPETADAEREFALSMLPSDRERARTYNLALLDFGAVLCQKRTPRCNSCFAREYCRYYRDETEDASLY